MRIEHNDPPLDVLKQMGYEPRDVAVGTLVRWLVYLWIFILAMSLVSMAIYWFFVPPREDVAYWSGTAVGTRRLPPNPIVQAYPRRDMAEYLSAEEAALEQHSWADRNRTRVNIPIEEAMQRLAAGGISGVTDQSAPEGKAIRAYPGSGVFPPEEPLPAYDQAPNDVTSYDSSANALSEGSPSPYTGGIIGAPGGVIIRPPGAVRNQPAPGGIGVGGAATDPLPNPAEGAGH